MVKTLNANLVHQGIYKRLKAKPHSLQEFRQALENLKAWGLYDEGEPLLPTARLLILELMGLDNPGELEDLCKGSAEFKRWTERNTYLEKLVQAAPKRQEPSLKETS